MNSPNRRTKESNRDRMRREKNLDQGDPGGVHVRAQPPPRGGSGSRQQQQQQRVRQEQTKRGEDPGDEGMASPGRANRRARRRLEKELNQADPGDDRAASPGRANRRARRRHEKELDQGNAAAVSPNRQFSNGSDGGPQMMQEDSGKGAKRSNLPPPPPPGPTKGNAGYGAESNIADGGESPARNFRSQPRMLYCSDDDDDEEYSSGEDLRPGAFNVNQTGVHSRSKGTLTESQHNPSSYVNGTHLTTRNSNDSETISAYTANPHDDDGTETPNQPTQAYATEPRRTSRGLPPPDAVERVAEDELKEGSKMNMKILLVGLTCLVLVVAIAVGIPVALKGGGDNDDDGTTPPTSSPISPAPSVAPTGSPALSQRAVEFMALLENSVSDPADLQDPTKPQYQALIWLADVDTRKLDPNNEENKPFLLDRYLIALLYFAMVPKDLQENDFLAFLSSASVCGWNDSIGGLQSGVGCTNGRVDRIQLVMQQLEGTIPTELFLLDELQLLHLGKNNLKGPLPTEIGLCTNLIELDVGGNLLTGALPTALGSLNALEVLSAATNSFTGTIPESIFQLTSLRRLILQRNSVGGPIPTELGLLTSLFDLNLAETMYSSTMPSEIGRLSSLRFLELFLTQLSGAIPSEIGMLSILTDMKLARTFLESSIPSEIGYLTELAHLDLESTFVDGAIPPELLALPKLTTLKLGDTSLLDDFGVMESLCENNTHLAELEYSVCDTDIACSCCFEQGSSACDNRREL